ncbi:hypothetical protein AX16_009234 [Volvariella volvacea WC 439]|nr:hypothetical protein AX16_009234 [Volvariella volvacea WC 439]
MPNTVTQPITPEYTKYTNAIIHHLENLTMSYRQNPETSLPIGKYIRQIEAQQLAQEMAITNLVTSLQATREAVQNQAGRFRQVLDAGRHLEEQLDQRTDEITDLVESGACQCGTQAHQDDQIAVLNGTIQFLTTQLNAITKQQKDSQKTLDRAIVLFGKQQDRTQQLEIMLNQVKMEEWEKKLDQILQGSAPPPPPPVPAPVPTQPSIPPAPKIPAPAPFNGTSKNVSPAINCIQQYAAILIGQYPNIRLGDLIDKARLRYFNSTDPNALITLFAEFEVEFGDRMKQEKAREWIASCKQGHNNILKYSCNFKHQARLVGYKDLNLLIATFHSGMNARLVEDVIRNGGLQTTIFEDFVILTIK